MAQPTAVYLRVGSQDAQRLSPLLSLSLGQMYRELNKIAGRSPGNRLEREVRLTIDEFGSLPRILGIETALATLRSVGVGHALYVQSSAQIAAHYGRDLATTIQDNLVTRVILGGASSDDAKGFSQRCGEVTEYHPSRSWNRSRIFGGRSQHFSYTPERHPLISPSDIIHLRDTVLVSTRGISPIRADRATILLAAPVGAPDGGGPRGLCSATGAPASTADTTRCSRPVPWNQRRPTRRLRGAGLGGSLRSTAGRAVGTGRRSVRVGHRTGRRHRPVA